MNIHKELSRVFKASECENIWECEVALNALCELRWQAVSLGKPQAAILMRRDSIRAKMAEFQA